MDTIIENSLGVQMPTAVKTLVDCEVPGCMDYTHKMYTTCEKHTRLLEIAGIDVKISPHPVYVYNNTHVPIGDTVFDFRFSASYASRYNNCHGSANLEQAIPGFVHPEQNERGMKGEGTRLHKIFETAVSGGGDLRAKARLLRALAGLWGPKRTEKLQNPKEFLIWAFMLERKPPVMEAEDLAPLLIEKRVLNPDKTPKLTPEGKEQVAVSSIPPRRIELLADSLEYVADIIDSMDEATLEIFVEKKVPATWLTTEPKTTVDLVIRDKNKMHVLDMKFGDILVSAMNNEQLMYYAATFMTREDGTNYEDITLHIMQRNNTNKWELPVAVHRAWMDKVIASEKAILDGDLSLSPGKHCEFCPANPHTRGDKGNRACPAMMDMLYGERDMAVATNDVLEYTE